MGDALSTPGRRSAPPPAPLKIPILPIRALLLAGVLSITYVATVIGHHLGSEASARLWAMAGVYGAYSVILFWAGAKRAASSTGVYLQLVVDSAFLGTAIHIAGGLANPFAGLFVVLSACGGLLLDPGKAKLASVGIGVFVLGQTVLESTGLLSPGCWQSGGGRCFSADPSQVAVWGTTAAFLAVISGLVMSRLSYALQKSHQQLSKTNARLEAEARHLSATQTRLTIARQQLQSILDCMADAVVFANPDGRIALFNRAAASLFAGQDASDLRVCHSPDIWERLLSKLQNPGTNEQHPLLSIGGRSFEASYARVSNEQADELLGAVMVARDVTERLVEQHANVEREKMATIGRLAATLTHELNNPLCAIALFTQHMLKTTAPDEPLAEQLETVNRNANLCRKIVSDLLQYARQRPPEKELLVPRRLLEEAARTLEPQSNQHGVDIEIDVDDDLRQSLWGDRDQLRQALVNLGMNAIDAMPRGGTLRFGARADDGRGVLLTVADTGSGIAKEDHERVFGAFYTTKATGTGLGLAVVRDLVAAHNGKVELESDTGCGTTFSICLPAAEAEQPTEGAA